MTKSVNSTTGAKKILNLLIWLYILFIVLFIMTAILRRVIITFRKPKKKQTLHTYKILIPGSSWLRLRSNTQVRISLQGTNGTTPFYALPNKHYTQSAITEESVLNFTLITSENLKTLTYITLWVEEKTSCHWYLDLIIVEDVERERQYNFEFYCTLEIRSMPKLYIVSCESDFSESFISNCVASLLKVHNWYSAFVRGTDTFDVSSSTRFVLILVVVLHSLFLGVVNETMVEGEKGKILDLSIDTFYFIYLLIFTLIPDTIIHCARTTRNWGRQVWKYDVIHRHVPRKDTRHSSSSWDYLIERRQVSAFGREKKTSDELKRFVDLEAGDAMSVDSVEMENLTQQRLSVLTSHSVEESEMEFNDEDVSDTISWMGFYDQESPFFVIPRLDKYDQFSTLFHPFNPNQLVHNRVSLWIHFLRKWHKVQLRAINSYRFLYALWPEWDKLEPDLDMNLLQEEMNKMQAFVVEFQNTGQEIRDRSIWLKNHPMWRVAIELPQDEKLLEPYSKLIALLEHTVIHVMTNFLDHFNIIQIQRKLSRDIEWFIEDWFRELLQAFIHEGYLIKKTGSSESSERQYWLPPRAKNVFDQGDSRLIYVVPPLNQGSENKKSADATVAKAWAMWLPSFLKEIGDHILDAMRENLGGLNLVDAITYIQMQKEGCSWEEACVRVMGITADVILQDIMDNMCVFLSRDVKRVILQRTRATLVECLNESTSPWVTYSVHDHKDRQRHYTLVSILRGCVTRSKTMPLGVINEESDADDPMFHANKVHLYYLLSGELELKDLSTNKLIPRLNEIATVTLPKIAELKKSVQLIRQQFDEALATLASVEVIRRRKMAVIFNTLLTLCRLERSIAHVELCRDALDLDTPFAAMVGNYNKVKLKQVFRLLATQYGQTRLGRRYTRHPGRRSISRVEQPRAIQLQINNEKVDQDVLIMLRHPWFAPVSYVWGALVRLWLFIEIVVLTFGAIHLSDQLESSSFGAVCALTVVGMLMDFAFVQPSKCFLFVFFNRTWQRKGVRYIYQEDSLK